MENKIEIDNKTIGQRMRKERKALGLSQEKLAEIVGLSNYYIGQLERGERQMSLPALVEITNCLHVSLDYLVLGEYSYDSNHIKETHSIYNSNNNNNNNDIEIIDLINKCSLKELKLFIELIKTILPYMKQ